MNVRDVSKPDLSHLTPGQLEALALALKTQRAVIDEDGWIKYVEQRRGATTPMAVVLAAQAGHAELSAAVGRARLKLRLS